LINITMDATNNIATDLFYKIRSRFRGLKLGDELGQITINPESARFFDFDYMEGETPIGHVSISLAESSSMKVYFSSGITESMDSNQKNHWYGFLKELRSFAKRRLMAFDTRDIAKDNLDKRDFTFLSQHNKPAQSQQNNIVTPVGENIMSESALYGSKTISYQKLMDTRLIIKHSKTLTDDQQPGARTRNISALFVENQEGERFKYPFIHLAGARAMQRHVANSGLPYDEVGKSIIGMSEEIAQLRSFSNYVVRNDLMNSMNNGIVERSTQYLNSLREQVKALAKQSHYEAFKENFQAQQPMDIPEDVVEQFTDQFTVKNFKEDIKSVFPVLYRLMQEENTIGYDDIVAMTAAGTESIDTEVVEGTDEFDKFESWVMGLGESSAIASQDPEEQAQAVKQLQELVGQHFSAGVDGSNAIESLKGIIDDPKLFQAIKNQSKEDPDSCTRGLVKDWLEANSPEVVDQLDFGDFVEEPKEDQGAKKSDIPAYMRKAKGGDDWKVSQQDLEKEKERNISSKEWLRKQNNESLNIQELAEFVQSFYDKDSGTFPKGPEGVAIMVGKKYGEQAEMVARKFVERMAPGQQVPENIDIGDGIVVGGRVVSVSYPDMTGEVVMIDPKMAQRVHVQWDRGGRAEPMQRSKLKAVAAEDIELARIRELSGMPDTGVAEESSGYYYERLAQEVFDNNPNLDTSGRDPEVLNAVFPLLVRDLGSRKKANNLLNYDEDFAADFVSAYGELKKNSGSNESSTMELEAIRRLSGISQGMGF
jgi:hypothetical protein